MQSAAMSLPWTLAGLQVSVPTIASATRAVAASFGSCMFSSSNTFFLGNVGPSRRNGPRYHGKNLALGAQTERGGMLGR